MSHKGHDDIKCGVNHHPCHTLSYTLEQRAKDDDVIQINGEDGTPYPIKRQNLVLRNITLIGTGSRARITGEFSVVDSYLFADVSRGLNTSPEQVSINLVNLKLIRIGIIKLKNTLTTLNIHVVNCTVLKLSKSPIVDSSTAKTTVILRNNIIRHVSKGLQVKNREFSLNITSSKIDNSGWSYPGQDCPQFIVTDQFESLVAHLSKSSFKYTFLMDLAASRHQKSNVTIIDSIFDDDSKNIKHNGCSSGITLRNTNALIVNSNFTNIISRKSLIKAIDSFVTFKECIFSNISKLSMFSLSSSIIAAFNKINPINNKRNGLNYGSVYLLSTKGIFQNCRFHNNTVNGQHGTGGAMCISNSNITVQQCLFKENTVTVAGGAIFMQETRGSFVNCTFERNSVESRSQRNGYGGAVCAITNSHLTVHDCLFKENTANYSGGAITMKETRGSFVNCTFEGNSVESRSQRNGYGGAVCAITNSHLTVHDCLFKENTANCNGGATYIQKSHINIKQCLFKENTANYSGGAIFMRETRGSFVNCTFERNSVESRLQRYDFGGAVSARTNSHLTVHHCLFKENTATYIGGAIFMLETRGSVVNCTFERNSVESHSQGDDFGGAVSAITNSHLTVQHCLFKENTATFSGGATYIQESHIDIKQCLFNENTANNSGGAISMKETGGSFVNCTFERNSVGSSLQSYGYGGAVCAITNSHLTVHDCLFKENTANCNGGATYIQKSHINIKQCLFKENTANYSGGAIFMRETRGSFVNCTFERNSVESRLQRYDFGGAVSARTNSHLTVHHCLFKENTANYSGGAISMQGTRGSFVNCTFERNSVESPLRRYHYGGAVSAITNSHLTMHHCLFKENTATDGGGATYIQESHIDIKQCLFKENTATDGGGAISMKGTGGSFVNCTFERNSVESSLQRNGYGGAVCAITNSHLTVHHCLFKENTAAYIGGATYIQESHIDVKQCLFNENTATVDGGAISIKNTRGSFVNCTFERNSVESSLQRNSYGGAVCAMTNSHLTVHHCVFKENKATYSGGATYIQESHINIKWCLFTENTSNYSGGAISMQETRGSFVNSTFERNSVESPLRRYHYGGAVRATTNYHLAVHHCLFKENTATYIGGAIFMLETRGSVVNCTFERNSVESHSQGDDFGGAVSAITNSHLTVQHCLFKENTATFSGGATYIQESHIDIKQCLFKENTANYSGGAISMKKTRGSFVNSTFERNSVEGCLPRDGYGGAVCAITNSHLTVHHCLFKENTATVYGGATYIQKSQSLFENCIFERNKVNSLHQNASGGAINAFGLGTNINIKQCLFKENMVTVFGGAIAMVETRALFVNCTFERNFAESRSQRYGYGGAVNAMTSSHLTVHHSLFKENEATSHGGATFIQASHINIEQCFFKENTVNYSGGAIFMNEAQGSFENCTFADNAVRKLQETTFGGAISSIRGSFFRLTQCFFKKNTATFYGGACYIQRSQGSFENCTFEGKV